MCDALRNLKTQFHPKYDVEAHTSWRLELPNIASLLEVLQIYLILFVEVITPFHLIVSKWASALSESRAYFALDH